MVETLTYTYTSEDEILRIYGDTGMQGIIQDLSQNNREEWWTELIADASDIINEYCEVFYEPSAMETSTWVRRRAAWIGAYLLSQRRGNPAIFQTRFEMILDELAQVRAGVMLIPRLETRSDFTPAMSNMVVQDYFYQSKIRVHTFISTGGNNTRQDPSYYWPFEWL